MSHPSGGNADRPSTGGHDRGATVEPPRRRWRGRRSTLSLDVVRRIVDERRAGRSWAMISNGLIADGVPTAMGGQWHPNTVRQVFNGQDAQALMADDAER